MNCSFWIELIQTYRHTDIQVRLDLLRLTTISEQTLLHFIRPNLDYKL